MQVILAKRLYRIGHPPHLSPGTVVEDSFQQNVRQRLSQCPKVCHNEVSLMQYNYAGRANMLSSSFILFYFMYAIYMYMM